MRATYRQLEVFLAIADRASFSAAARSLRISQAAVSRHMRLLENRLGQRLFERKSGETAYLSEYGRDFLARVPAIFANRTHVSQPAYLDTRKVRVAGGDIIFHNLFLPHIEDFQRNHPDIQVELIELPPSAQSVSDMAKKNIDLAYFTFAANEDVANGDLIGTVPFGIFISPKHELANWNKSSKETLPIVTYLAGSAQERTNHFLLKSENIRNYRIVSRSQYSSTIIRLAEYGLGACCMFKHLVKPQLEAGSLIELKVNIASSCGRYRFRRIAPMRIPYVDTVEQFLTSLAACG